MTIRKALTMLTLAAAGLAITPVAYGAQSADTTLSVTVGTGNLSIAAPTNATLTNVAPAVGTITTGTVEDVTVTDTRGTLLGWSVTAKTATDNMARDDGEASIPLTAAGPLGWATGTVAADGGSLLSGVSVGAGGFLNATTPIPVAVSALGSGGGTYTFTPTVTLTVPPNTESGTYSVVVTQTVS